MAISEAKRQAAHRVEKRNPVSRTQRQSRARNMLVGLLDEANVWLNSRSSNYEDSDEKADQVSRIEMYVAELETIIELINDVEVPVFRVTNPSQDQTEN